MHTIKESYAAFRRQIIDDSGVIQYISLLKFYSGCLRRDKEINDYNLLFNEAHPG